ncbi:outer membrane murein-binding lipoprotein Lpp [Enterococcus sp. PF1-24]|uniref:DUF5067 domain-containing protein n=1 Tax=unclassified Enterococcus TaxID=2608891 RepID=UPI00247510E7|nr:MULTISPECIES: DUF5067 domain-containing protein [unclassified Enterococcus]MDH6364874.1 outer membrane murein-binding lipoprotein Lpp [Enterococcus sp. PFB1-1]MDH6401975.1 outer membrane murein-binding lipoprotein Lpp [Enterococcus sp. PF1-24]
MKKRFILSGALVCLLALSACGSSATEDSATTAKIDKLAKKVDALEETVDSLVEAQEESEKTVTKPSTKKDDDEKTVASSEEEKKTTDKKTETKKEEPKASGELLNTTFENDEISFTITAVDFLGNIGKYDDAAGHVVLSYTLVNNSDEKMEAWNEVGDYIDATEEDDLSEDDLYTSYRLSYYEPFKDRYENSQLNIKPGGTIDGAIAFEIKDLSKNLNIMVRKEAYNNSDKNILVKKTYTPEEIAQEFEKTKDILPD